MIRTTRLAAVSGRGTVRSTRAGRGLAALGFCVVMMMVPVPAAAQEFIVHVNGDSINADIKGFERGELEFEIPGGSSSTLEFDRILTFGSPDGWDIELTDNRRVFGSILSGTEAGSVRIASASDTVDTPISEVVEMTSVKGALWSRFDGFVEAGFQYARSNNATAYNAAAAIDYRSAHWAFGVSLDSRFQSQDDAESFKRSQGTAYAFYLLPRNWYLGAFLQYEQNKQLDLDLRGLLGTVGGRDLVQTNRIEWNWLLGLLRNEEEYTGYTAEISAEVLIGTQFSWFTFGDFENDLTANLYVYPSLTRSGRIRIDFDVGHRQDLFGDLYLRLSFYDQYDSKPPEGANANDFGTTLALGWDI